jgi:hypothetical protein
MKAFQPMPTSNQEWGFWGTSKHNGYDAELTWDTASHFLAENFDLSPEQTRNVLDSCFGRHLADDLSFIKSEERGIANGPSTAKAINKHLAIRIADKGWRDCFENAIQQETDKIYPPKKQITKDELFTQIAQRHLLVETLVVRKSDSLDFHSVGVWGIKDALEAAYEAGRAAKSKK